MKAQVMTNAKHSSNIYLNVQTQALLRSVVAKYIDYFFPNTTSSTAAIDNKIEQAMDLVKNHLMFTVREEVEVLKLHISELLDRISQLESENSFLRANASPEVLQALNTGSYRQLPQSGGGSCNQSVGGSLGKIAPH